MRFSVRLRNLKVKDPAVYFSYHVADKDKDIAVAYVNSNAGKSSCQIVRTSSSMLSKEKALSNKIKREEDSIYDTTLSTALFHYENSIKIRLKDTFVESCRMVVDDVNNTLLTHCEKINPYKGLDEKS